MGFHSLGSDFLFQSQGTWEFLPRRTVGMSGLTGPTRDATYGRRGVTDTKVL